MSKKSHYVHGLDYTSKERIVGLFVLGAILLLIAQLLLAGQALRLFESKITYVTYIQNPVGIGIDTKVRVSGLEVGAIDDVTITFANTFIVRFWVWERYHRLLRTDSIASVSKLAFIGDSVLNISPGSAGAEVLPNGSEVYTEEAQTLDQFLLSLQPTIEGAREGILKLREVAETFPIESVYAMIEDLEATTSNLLLVSEAIATGEGVAGTLVNDASLSSGVRELIQQSNITMESASELLASTNDRVNELEPFVEEIGASLDKVSQMLTDMQGESEKVPELILQTNRLMQDTQTLLDSMANIWPLSTALGEPTTLSPAPALPAD